MLIIGLGRKGSKLPPRTASCCRLQDATFSHQPPGGCSSGPGPHAWSRPLHRGARLKALLARGLPGSDLAGCGFCFADESGTDILGAVMCAPSGGSGGAPCAAHSPRGGRTSLGLCHQGKASTWGRQSPRRDRGTEPLPKTQPAASLELAPLPAFTPWHCPHVI